MGVEGYQVIAVEWAMVFMTALFVGLRLYLRVFSRGYWPKAEVFVIAAWLSFVIQGAMDTALLEEGFFGETWVNLSEHGYKILYAENALYMFCMYAIKAAMLCFYYELIPRIMRKTWIMLWVTVVVVVIGFIMTLISNLIACRPISLNWSTDPEKNCSANDTVFGGLTNLIFHLLTDIMIYILPFPVLRELHNLPRRQKVGVGITFGLGFLCIIMAVFVFAAEYIYDNPAFVWIWCVFEQTWSITVVCCPAFKALLTKKSSDRWSKALSPKGLSQLGTENISGSGSMGTMRSIGGSAMDGGKELKRGHSVRGSYTVSVDAGNSRTGRGINLNPIRSDEEDLVPGLNSGGWDRENDTTDQSDTQALRFGSHSHTNEYLA